MLGIAHLGLGQVAYRVFKAPMRTEALSSSGAWFRGEETLIKLLVVVENQVEDYERKSVGIYLPILVSQL